MPKPGISSETQSTEAKRIYDWYNAYLNSTRDRRSTQDRLEHIYHGRVFEVTEGAEAQYEGNTTVVDNRIRPLIRKQISKLIANKPTGKVFGVSEEDQDMVDTFSAMGDWFWEISDGQEQLTKAVLEMQKLGAGFLIVYWDQDADYGMGELKFDRVSYSNVFYDKQAERLDKAKRVIVRRLVDADDFFEDYPQHANERARFLHPDDSVRYTMEGSDRSRGVTNIPDIFEGQEKEFVLLLEEYRLLKEDGWVFRDLSPDGKLITARKAEFKTAEKFANSDLLSDDDRTLYESRVATIYASKVPRVKITRSVADQTIIGDPEYLELEKIPIIEFRGEDTFNGTPMGEIDYIASNQEFMNKALNLAIMNAAMGSLLRFIIDDQAVNGMTHDEVMDELQKHGGVLWMHRDPITGQFPIDTLKPEPLNEAFIYLVNYMAMTMEYGMQQHGLTMGDASQAPRTMGATMQIGEWADEANILPRREIERGIQKLYDVFFQWAPQVYTQFKTFSLFDSSTEDEKVYGVNQPAIDLDLPEELVLLSNMSNFRARWRVRTGSTAPTRSVEKAQLFKELLQVTQNPAFIPALIEHLPLGKYRKELTESVNLVPQLQNQVAELQKALQQSQGEVDRQIQQNIEARKALRVEKGTADFRNTVVQKEAQMDGALKDFGRAIEDVKSSKQSNTE